MTISQSEVEARLDAIDREIRRIKADLQPKPSLYEPYKRWWQGPFLAAIGFFLGLSTVGILTLTMVEVFQALRR